MKLSRAFRLALAGLLALGAAIPGAFAAFDPIGEDIDIFLANPSFPAERPNVLIMLDNTANWNTAFDNEKSALKTVVNGLNSNYNVGLMFFNQTGEAENHGAYIKFAVRQMTDPNKDALEALIFALDRTGDAGSNNVISEMVNEAYLYWAGLTAYRGFGQSKRDYPGNASNPNAKDLPGNAFAGSSSATYVSPITSGCQRNFQIYISNGAANENTDTLSDMEGKLAAITGTTPPAAISLSNVSPDDNAQAKDWMDEYAKFMANGDCNANFPGSHVFTYVIEIDRVTTGQGPAMTTLMKSVANNGKGKYFSVSSAGGGSALLDALNQIFQEVQSVNSVFASTTLPVSVNVRGTNLNQVYIGVFRHDATKSPRWFGNLKLYDLKVTSNGTLFLADADGEEASSNNGFIKSSVRSFWTTSSSFWEFRAGTYASTDVGQASDNPDGDLVEKGGVAEQLRIAYATSQATRNLYTCTGTCACSGNSCATPVSLSGSPFATSNSDIQPLALGALTTQPVAMLTSAGTTATATVFGHGFLGGEQVVIAGASPAIYNGTYTIVLEDIDTFSYTLASAPSITTATVAAAAHGLNSGDRLTVIGAIPQIGYNVTDELVTRVDANTFTYTLAAPVTAASNIPGLSVTGRKQLTTLTGIGTTATARLPSHGYSSGNLITITGATPAEFLVTDKAITVTGADTFTYTANASFTGDSDTAQAITTAAHNFNTNDTVTINCATPLAYNQTAVVSVAGTNTFTYNIGSIQSVDASVTTAPAGCAGATNIQVTKSGVSAGVGSMSVTSPSTVTVNTSAAHGFSAGQTVTIAGVTPTAFNGSFSIVSVPTFTSLTYTLSVPTVVGATTPATGTITSTVGATLLGIAATYTHKTTGTAAAQAEVEVNTGSTSPPSAFVVGASVTVAGATQAAYNGDFKITSVTTNGTNRGFTYQTGDVTGLPSPTLSSATASGSISRSIAKTCGAGTADCLQRAIAATGTIFAGKAVTVTSVTSQTNATGTITAADIASGSTTVKDAIINWVRGQDNATNENAPTDTSYTDVRSSVHGDVLHSRPAIVNYNRGGAGGSNTGDNDVFAFYGGNDGILHAVQGGFASNGGTEAWGFVAPEFFGKLKRLRDNSPIIGVASSSAAVRDYFFDGPIGVYTLDRGSDGAIIASAGDKVQLFVGMRRGGRHIYALDVSDPADPKFMWKRGCPNLTDNTGCDTGFEELGQTWSEPKLVFLKAYTNPVLIFGAGYDPTVEDFQPCLVTASTATTVTAQTGGSVTFTSGGSCTYSGTTATPVDRKMGRGIFIVDATDGTLLFRFGSDIGADKVVSTMQYAIPADVVVLNRDRDNTRALPGRESIQPLLSGFADRVYAVDTGGNVWRLDLDSATPADWVVTRLASLAGSTLANKRKFLFSPDVVFGKDSAGVNYDAVLLGSGDREHPFDTTITDRFYMLKDYITGLDSTAHVTIVDDTFNSSTQPNGLFDATSNCLQDTAVCTSEQQLDAASALLASRGWKLTLRTGEKNVGTATTLAGTTFFNTNQPSASAGESEGSCGSNLGIARQYLVSFADATATTNLNNQSGLQTTDRSVQVAGGGYLPSPVPLIVEIDGKKYQAVISGTQIQSPGGLKLEARVRSYWYRKIE